MPNIVGVVSREGGPEKARAVLGKTAAVTPGSRRGEAWHLFPFGLSSDVIMEGLVSVLIHQSQSGLAWCSCSVKLIMFSRVTPRPGCECQAGPAPAAGAAFLFSLPRKTNQNHVTCSTSFQSL